VCIEVRPCYQHVVLVSSTSLRRTDVDIFTGEDVLQLQTQNNDTIIHELNGAESRRITSGIGNLYHGFRASGTYQAQHDPGLCVGLVIKRWRV